MNELNAHPEGESQNGALVPVSGPVAVDTFGGRIHVEWDPLATVTPLGQMPFFTEFLKVSGLFDPWVEDCPLQWTSPNAPKKRDVLGTAVLSILSGHRRYAHISALRGEGVNSKLLGMSKVVSEDSVRASFIKRDETKGIEWLKRVSFRQACMTPGSGAAILNTWIQRWKIANGTEDFTPGGTGSGRSAAPLCQLAQYGA